MFVSDSIKDYRQHYTHNALFGSKHTRLLIFKGFIVWNDAFRLGIYLTQARYGFLFLEQPENLTG